VPEYLPYIFIGNAAPAPALGITFSLRNEWPIVFNVVHFALAVNIDYLAFNSPFISSYMGSGDSIRPLVAGIAATLSYLP
jgi:hypothetical protein